MIILKPLCAGVLSKDGLPGFHYRDDTIRLWGAVQSFAADVVAVHYRDDEEVELDDELTLFLQVRSLMPRTEP